MSIVARTPWEHGSLPLPAGAEPAVPWHNLHHSRAVQWPIFAPPRAAACDCPPRL